MPFLLISPFAKPDYVSSSTADQTSVLGFIENNWLGRQRISSTSFDNLAGSLTGMFAFDHPDFSRFLLNPATGAAAQ